MLSINYKLLPMADINIFDHENISQEMSYQAIKQGKKYLNFDWKSIKASVYTNELRDEFVRLYRDRRIALANLAFSEFITKSGELLPDIIDGIWAICEESTWEMPSQSEAKLRDFEHPEFQLSSVKTAALLAMTLHLFRDDLPLNVKKRIIYEIRRRALDLFFEAKNVSPESVAYALLSAVLAEPDEEKRRKAADRAIAATEVFLTGYSEDTIKAKSEISFYKWSAYIFDILEILSFATDMGDKVFDDEKVRIVAKSIYKSYIGGDGFLEHTKETDGARLYLFGKFAKVSSLENFGAGEFIKEKDITLSESYNLFHKLISLGYASEFIEYKNKETPEEAGYINSMDIYLKRTSDFSVAVKGGAYFAGNFMAYLENEPYVVDLEKYHNLPIVNGFTQFANTKKASRTEIENGISIDMSETYPHDAGVIKWIREVEATDKYIIISDEYELSKKEDLRIVMLMRNKPILSGERILIGNASVVWDGNLALRADLVRSKNYGNIYRLTFHIKNDDLCGKVRIALTK